MTDVSRMSDDELMALVAQQAQAPTVPAQPIPVQSAPLPDISQPRDHSAGADPEGGARALARGVPVLGAAADEGNAAIAAAVSPYLEPMLRNAPHLAQQLLGYDQKSEISGAGNYGDRFNAAMNLQRFKDDSYDQAHPTQSKVLQGVGTVAGSVAALPALAAGSAALPVEAGLLPRMAVGALEGAGIGGAQGYAAGNGNWTDPSRIEGGLQGAAIGGAVGGATPAALTAGGALWKATGGKAIDAIKGARAPVQVPANDAEALAQALRGEAPVAAPINQLSNPDGLSAPLDMGSDARIARALQQGFNTKGYHGTGRAVDELKIGGKGGSGSPEGPLGVWATDNPETAAEFAAWSAAGRPGENILPVRLKMQNPLEAGSYDEISALVKAHTDADGVVDYDAVRAALQAQGKDSIALRNTLTDSPGSRVGADGTTPIDQYAVLSPAQVRPSFDEYNPGGEARVGLPRPGDFQATDIPPPVKGDAEALAKAIRGAAPQAASTQAPPLTRDSAEIISSRQQVPVTQVPASAEEDAYARIAQALGRQRQTPEEMVAGVQALGPRGMIVDSGEAMRDLARAAANRPSGASDIAKKALDLRQAGDLVDGEFTIRPASGRILDQAAEGLGVADKGFHGEIDNLLASRKAAAGPAYAKAYEAPPVDIGELRDFAGTKLFRDAYGRARAISEKEFVTLPDGTEKIVPLPEAFTSNEAVDWRTLDLMKQGLDDLVKESKVQGIGANDQGATKGYLKRFVSKLDEMNPDYKAARDAFAGPTAMKDALESGRAALREDAPDLAKTLSGLSPSEQQMYRLGAYQGLKDKLGNTDITYDAARNAGFLKPNQLERFKELFPDKAAFGQFANMLKNEQTMFQTRGAVLGNSSTAKQLANMADQDASVLETVGQAGVDLKTMNVMGLIKALGKVGGPAKLSEPTAEALASILTNMDQAGLAQVAQRLTEAQKRQILAETLRGTASAGGVSGATTAAQPTK